MRHDSEDGFEDDDDGIINLDFIPNLEIPFEETQELDIDNIIENIEYNAIFSQQPTIATTSSQLESSSRRQNREKFNITWRKRNLELNEPQLRFTEDEMLPQSF